MSWGSLGSIWLICPTITEIGLLYKQWGENILFKHEFCINFSIVKKFLLFLRRCRDESCQIIDRDIKIRSRRSTKKANFELALKAKKAETGSLYGQNLMLLMSIQLFVQVISRCSPICGIPHSSEISPWPWSERLA